MPATPESVLRAWFDGVKGEIPVYAWSALGAGSIIRGPAFVEQGLDGARAGLHITFQMSRAYSPIVRSDENQPTWAMLWIAEARHAAWSAQRASTARWAAA